jgi:hypothetical protein
LLNWYEWTILVVTAVGALAALIAALTAWRESRRNNSVVLKVVKCVGSLTESVDENKERAFTEFSVLIRNRGLPLYGMTAKLVFHEVGRLGSLHIALKNRSEAGPDGIFAKGMLAEFSLKSYDLGDDGCKMLAPVVNARKHRASLCVYSQGYQAAEFPLTSLFDPLRMKWNRTAVGFNGLFDRQVGVNERGTPIVKSYRLLPLFPVPAMHLDVFLSHIRREHRVHGADNGDSPSDSREVQP